MLRYVPGQGYVSEERESRRPVAPELERVPWWQRPLREIDRGLQAVADALYRGLPEDPEAARAAAEMAARAAAAQEQARTEAAAASRGRSGLSAGWLTRGLTPAGLAAASQEQFRRERDLPEPSQGLGMELLALPLRPTSALAAPLLEAARRLRTGEPLGDFDYGREMGRQLGHGLPGVGEPRVDLFRTGTEIVAGREGDPTRWPALLGGVGAELLPIAPYLAVGFGTASTRTVRGSWARAASAAGQRAAAETGSAEVGATVTSRFRSVVDEFLPGRRSAPQYFKQARTGRAQVTPSEIALGEDALTERIAPRLYEEAEAAGLSPRVAGRVVDQFLADVQWEAQPHWRVEWPGGARPLAEWQRPSRVAGRGPTPVLQPGMQLAPSRELIDVYGMGETASRMQGELFRASQRLDPLDMRAWQAGGPPAPRMIRRLDAAVRAADPALTAEQAQQIVRGWLRESRGGVHGGAAIGYPFVEAEVGVLQGELRFQARPQAGTTMTYRYYQPRARRLPGQMRAVGEKRAWAPVESAVEVEARLAHERELGRLRREIAEIDELLRTVRPAARFAAPEAPTTAAPTGVPEWARRPLVAPEYEPSARGALAPEGAQTAQPTPETGVSSQIQAAPESPGVPATQRPGEAPADLVQEEARFPIDLSGAERDENGDYILYHGTTRDRAEYILRYGLYGDPRYGPALTALPSQAGTFAQQRYELSGFVGEPVILRVRVPAAEAGNFRENVDPRSLGYSGPVIPPEWVVDVVPAKERWRLDDAYRAWSERQAAPAPRPVQTTIEGEAERVAPERSTLEERQGRPMARGRPQQIGFDAFAEETPQTTLADFTGEAQQMVGREGFGVSRDTAPAAPAEEDAFAAAAELTPEEAAEAARHAEELEAPEVAGGAEVPATPKPAIPAPTPLAAPPPIPIQAARPLVDEATAMRAERRAARALNARLRELAKELRREHRLAPKGSGTRMQLRAMLTEVGKAIKPQSERTALGRAARAAEAKARRAPELAPPRYDIAAAVADAVADAAGAFAERTRSQREALRQQLLATARPRPGESPLQTATRTIIEGYGVAYTPQLAGLAENVERAGLERLRAAKAKQLADLEAAGPDTAAFTAYHREAGIRSEEARAARSLRARAGQVSRWFVKWPGVLIEHRRTLELCQTEVDALIARLLGYGDQVFGGRYRGGRLHPTTANERRVVTWLLTARALGASPADELTVVLESLRPHVGEQKLGQPEDYLTSTGTIAMSKLPPVARRVFEIAAELRKLYDEMRDGSDAVGPGFVEMKLALGLPPGTLEDYVPQPPILPFGPEDYEIVSQLALREFLLGREDAERFAREQYGRPDITEHRTWADRTAALQAFLESARRGEPEQRALKEPDAEACYRWYVHRFAALRTVYLVQQWLKDHAYTELDYRLDPNVGNTGVNEMYETGWGPPNPWGHTPESMEGYLLPPQLRAAVNEVLSSGTAPALFDQMFRTWVRPWMKYLRPWQVAPLQTLRFLGTQLWELGTNMVFLTSRAGPRQLWEGLLMANQMLSRDLLAIMERYPPTSWAQASQAQCATARANLVALATRRWGVTVADVDALLAKAERANLLSGAVGSQAKEEVETIVTGWTGVAEDEARVLVDAGTGLIMNWDRLCRTWAFCTLLLEGYSETEAAAAVREWTVSYDRAARRPWHDGASYFLFYWRWAAERTEQYASLAYKRPGVLLAVAQLDEEDRERYLGLSPGQAALAGGRPPWMATQLDIAAVRWDCPITRNIKRHLEECKYLEAWDGYYMPYVRFAVPLLDWLGTAQEAMAKPHEYFAEQLMPVGRGLVEAERGRPLREIQKGIPLVGPWVRAADKFPTEVWDEIELQIGPIDLGHDVPLEAFERVAEAGRTPEYCRTPRRWQGRPKAQRVRYEAEKMRLYFLIERAARSSGAAIYVQTVPQALDNMTTGQCAAAIAAIDAGEDLRRWPGDRPARFRAALEKEIEQREAGVTHEFDANPRTRGEQIGGIPGWVSRQLRPEKELVGR